MPLKFQTIFAVHFFLNKSVFFVYLSKLDQDEFFTEFLRFIRIQMHSKSSDVSEYHTYAFFEPTYIGHVRVICSEHILPGTPFFFFFLRNWCLGAVIKNEEMNIGFNRIRHLYHKRQDMAIANK